MRFNETLIFLVIFAAIYNLLTLFELRLKAGSSEKLSKSSIWIIAFVMIASTTIFVGASCYVAFQGFASAYSSKAALLATSFFAIVGVVLIRKLMSALRMIPKR